MAEPTRPGENRSQFPGHGQGHDRSHIRFRAEPLESGVALKRQNHAGKRAGDEHYRYGADSEFLNLFEKASNFKRGSKTEKEGFAKKDQDPPGFIEKPQRPCANQF
jgi:hypothetical protein